MRVQNAQLLKGVADIVGIGAHARDLRLVARKLGFSTFPVLPSGSDSGGIRNRARKRIDEIAVAGGVDERAVVMLAVDLDEGAADVAQELHADGHVVDESAAAAIGALHAAENERGFAGDVVCG